MRKAVSQHKLNKEILSIDELTILVRVVVLRSVLWMFDQKNGVFMAGLTWRRAIRKRE